VPAAIAFILGLVFQECFAVPLGIAGAVCLIGFAIVFCGPRKRFARWPAVWLAIGWLCLGMTRLGIWQQQMRSAYIPEIKEEASPVRVRGRVFSQPERIERPDQEPALSFILAVCQVRLEEGWRSRNAKLQAFVPAGVVLGYGDEVLIEGRWALAPAATNPGQYDRRAALRRRQVAGVLTASDARGVVKLAQGNTHPLWHWPRRLHQHWQMQLHAVLDPKRADFLCSMLLGERGKLDEPTQRSFIETGTMHLLVVSGFNVGIIAVLSMVLLGASGLPWPMRLVFAAMALGAYGFVTGMDAPVARATLMAWMIIGASLLDRVARWDNLVAAATLVLLLIDPTEWMDASFQLSFGAVISLLVFVPPYERWLTERMPQTSIVSRAVRWVLLIAGATVAVWIGLWPVLAAYFHLVTPVSILANIALTPLVSLAVWAGMLILCVGLISPPIIVWCAGVLGFLVDMILAVVRSLHAIPGAWWVLGGPTGFLAAGYYALLALTLFGVRRHWRGRFISGAWLLALSFLVWTKVGDAVASRRWLRMDILDVGHGDALLMRLPEGGVILLDAGTEHAGRTRVVPFLRKQGIQALDALILTHPDSDHIGGAIPVLEQVPVRRLLTNGTSDDTMAFLGLSRIAHGKRIPHTTLYAGMRLACGEKVSIEVVHPPVGFVPRTDPASNDNALVLRVTMGEITWLLTADLEEAGIPVMLEQRTTWRAQLLKVPHHGSRLGSAGQRLFDAVQPDLAIVSVGRLHHLPASQTLEDLEAIGAQTLLTRDEGWIHVETDGKRMRVRSYLQPTLQVR